jgi:hypothetical protein
LTVKSIPISEGTIPSKLNTGKPFKGYYYYTLLPVATLSGSSGSLLNASPLPFSLGGSPVFILVFPFAFSTFCPAFA